MFNANARPRFTISLKRSTQNLQLSTSSPADYPIFWHRADMQLRPLFGRYGVESGPHRLVMSISAFDPKRTFGSLPPGA